MCVYFNYFSKLRIIVLEKYAFISDISPYIKLLFWRNVLFLSR